MAVTLTVNFTLASPDPGSYRVKYWRVDSPLTITTVLVSTSPFVQSGLADASYEGTVEASCGGGLYSTPQSFTAALPYYVYINSGRGNTEGEACTDSSVNNRTFYSDCDSASFGVGCEVYTDATGSLIVGYSKIFMNGFNWDVNSTTGVVTGLSSAQC